MGRGEMSGAAVLALLCFLFFNNIRRSPAGFSLSPRFRVVRLGIYTPVSRLASFLRFLPSTSTSSKGYYEVAKAVPKNQRKEVKKSALQCV